MLLLIGLISLRIRKSFFVCYLTVILQLLFLRHEKPIYYKVVFNELFKEKSQYFIGTGTGNMIEHTKCEEVTSMKILAISFCSL